MEAPCCVLKQFHRRRNVKRGRLSRRNHPGAAVPRQGRIPHHAAKAWGRNLSIPGHDSDRGWAGVLE
jgi:hypothetical protein